jgi:NADPH:quinone reductase
MATSESQSKTMRAVTVDAREPRRLVIDQVPKPQPGPGEVLIRVAAFSLNRGEVRNALAGGRQGARLGWDIAGTIERAAADGSSPPAGARVVAIDAIGGWAEFTTLPAIMLAPIPPQVSFAQAATLPVAGLTALHSLRRGGELKGKRVLVSGASGGVGSFACQLAHFYGAQVVAAIREPSQGSFVKSNGANLFAIGSDLSAARPHAPFDLILESVGGASLGAALTMLAPGGTCVVFGVSESSEVRLDAGAFYRIGGTTLFGLMLNFEFQHEPPSVGLAYLAGLVAEGNLKPAIEVEAPWTEIDRIAKDLMNRRFLGKAVLRI